jgi:hypothetical protein
MKLSRKDYEFNNPRICHIMPKHIDLDRVMIGLYMLLKYDGRRPVSRVGRIEVDVDYLADQLIQQHGDVLKGFQTYRDVVEDWIHSDLVDMVYRGHPDKERVASPRPLHLNAYKLRNPRYSKDYRGPEHLYSMLLAGDPSLVGRLAAYLGQGMDPASRDSYDGQTPLDLNTLVVVRMVDNPHLQEKPSGEGGRPELPLCLGQARLLCGDLRRLLAYQDLVPRPVLIDYLRTAFGLHLGLYLLRLFNQLTGWVADRGPHPACLNCPVEPERMENPFADCPFAFQNPEAGGAYRQSELLVDMGEDYTSHMAVLSRDNCARHYGRINDYIQAVFTVNQLFQFAESYAGQRHLSRRPESVADVLHILAQPSPGLDNYFSGRIDNILPAGEVEEEREEVQAIYHMQGLSPLETFVELVALERTRYYRKYLTEQLDSVLMKNQETGLLRQGKGRRNERRWHLGSRLLETLVQIAVLEPVGRGAGAGFRSRPILVDDFVSWLQARYGLALAPRWPDATIQDYEAFNANLRYLKDRLREIGFYTDLSDAYNAQVIRPRYTMEYEAL